MHVEAVNLSTGIPKPVRRSYDSDMDETLFDLPPTEPTDQRPEAARGAPRVQRPDRNQIELRSVDLDGLLPADHRARLVWAFVEGLDLEPLYARIRATEGEPGRPPIDPAILTALWLYATLEAVGSARALDRLCAEHDAYRWLAGGVGVNYHTLADFRVAHGELFDRILTESVAALLVEGLVTLDRVAQDGVRVRASAGSHSYRQGDALTAAVTLAETQVAALRAELEDDPGATSRRVAAARERAAAERIERAKRALARLPELEARKARRSYRGRRDVPPRVSSSDPDAEFMKFADGGVRPAYNAQFATDTASQIIVGLDIGTETDQRQLGPMVDQLQGRYGRAPHEHLVDGGYRTLPELERLAGPAIGTTVFMPVPQPRNRSARDRHRPRRGDLAAVAEWRIRMGTDEAKAIYRERAATAECVNAIARNRGLTAFRVRGRTRVRAVLLWFALAHNLMRAVSLRAAAVAT
jgi:transposase